MRSLNQILVLCCLFWTTEAASLLHNSTIKEILRLQLRNDYLLEQFLVEEFSYEGVSDLMRSVSDLPFRDIHADSFFKAGVIPKTHLRKFVEGRNISKLFGPLELKPWVPMEEIKNELAKCGNHYNYVSMSQQHLLYDKHIYGTTNIWKFACRYAFDDVVVYGVAMERFRFRFKDVLLNKIQRYWASTARSITIRDMQKLMNHFTTRFVESVQDHFDKEMKKLTTITDEMEEEEEELEEAEPEPATTRPVKKAIIPETKPTTRRKIKRPRPTIATTTTTTTPRPTTTTKRRRTTTRRSTKKPRTTTTTTTAEPSTTTTMMPEEEMSTTTEDMDLVTDTTDFSTTTTEGFEWSTTEETNDASTTDGYSTDNFYLASTTESPESSTDYETNTDYESTTAEMEEGTTEAPKRKIRRRLRYPLVASRHGCVQLNPRFNSTEDCNNLQNLPVNAKEKLLATFPADDIEELPYMTKDHTFQYVSIPVTIRVMLTDPLKIPQVLDIFQRDLCPESRDLIEHCIDQVCEEPDEIDEISYPSEHSDKDRKMHRFFQDRAMRYNLSPNNTLFAYGSSTPRFSFEDTLKRKSFKLKKPVTQELTTETRKLWYELLQSQVAENFAIHHNGALKPH